jgi:UDP-glucose 4-epimerase
LIELGGARVLVLRVSNLIFDHADPERPQGIMPRLVEAARTGRPVEIWGDGSATKDYLHVGDFVRAVVLLCREPASGIYNVGSGTSCSLLDLCKTVEAVVGSPIRRIHLPHYDWDVSRSLLSVAKLRRACSWQPDFSIEHAIRRMTS